MRVKVHIPPFQSYFKLVVSRRACTKNRSKYTINGRASAYDEVQTFLHFRKQKAISISNCPLGTFSPSTFDTLLRRTQTEVTDPPEIVVRHPHPILPPPDCQLPHCYRERHLPIALARFGENAERAPFWWSTATLCLRR